MLYLKVLNYFRIVILLFNVINCLIRLIILRESTWIFIILQLKLIHVNWHILYLWLLIFLYLLIKWFKILWFIRIVLSISICLLLLLINLVLLIHFTSSWVNLNLILFFLIITKLCRVLRLLFISNATQLRIAKALIE